MAKFGFDERRLFNISEQAFENLSSTPSDADSGQMLAYIKNDLLYIKKPSVAEVLLVHGATNVGTGVDVFKQQNAAGQLEFRKIKSADGRLDIAINGDDIEFTVDFTDINDDLDHGLLQGLADDDHLQYFKVNGRNNESLTINGNGNLLFGTDGGGNIGAVGATRPNNAYIKNLVKIGEVSLTYDSSTDQSLKVSNVHGDLVVFSKYSNGQTRSYVDFVFEGANKGLIWANDGQGDIGYSLANRPGAVRAKTHVSAQSASTNQAMLESANLVSDYSRLFLGDPTAATKGNVQVTQWKGNGVYKEQYLAMQDVGGSGYMFGRNEGDTSLTITRLNAGTPTDLFKFDNPSGTNLHFKWSVDGGGDIGASGANRPNNVYIKNSLTIAALNGVLKASSGLVSAGATTSDLPEGSNLYFTDERAQDAVGSILTDSATVDFTYNDAGNTITASVIQSGIDHGSISGLGDDDHTQYLHLPGRAGGQIANGGTAASENLELRSTAHATKGSVKIVDGSALEHADTFKQQYVLQTTSATESDIAVIPLSDDRVYNVKARLVARRSDGGGQARAAWELRACAYRAAAGAATLQGAVQYDFQNRSSGSINAVIDVNGNDMRVRVQGLASQTFEFKLYLEYTVSN
jgi:hypothetical protein